MEIVKYPAEILSGEAEEVTIEEMLSPSFQKVIDDMITKALSLSALGLAGPQVGIPKKIFVYRTKSGDFEALINAKMLFGVDRVTHHAEGCLSLPGISYDVKRFKKIKVEGYNRAAEKVTMSFADKLTAFCIQHEIDHCSGVTLNDKGKPR